MNLSITPGNCNYITSRNAELVNLISYTVYQKKWMILKRASYYAVLQLEFQARNITGTV